MDNELMKNEEQGTKRKSSAVGIILSLVFALAAFISGLNFSSIAKAESQTAGLFSIFTRAVTNEEQVIAESTDLSEFWQVWKLLEERYVSASSSTDIATKDKIYGAIEGLVDSYGDPYTIFLPPEESAAFAEDIAGNFSGIGMEVGSRDGVITVIAPLVDTPAERAGLLSGDLILKIDGESTEGVSIDEAVRKIRGPKDTSVTLSIFREGELEIRDITVVRDTIVVPTVKTEDKGEVFIISLYSFNAMAEVKMQEAIEKYKMSKATKLILDLRGNPGGYLQSAVVVASHFLPAGKIVVREQHGDIINDKLYRSLGKTLGDRSPKSMVVLIDNGSASASEILAGALSEHGYATLIGVNTFGKGSVQELIDVAGGSTLKVTIARWLTPNGLSISEGGLSPDIVVERTAEERLEDKDSQLEAALDFLSGKEVVGEEL